MSKQGSCANHAKFGRNYDLRYSFRMPLFVRRLSHAPLPLTHCYKRYFDLAFGLLFFTLFTGDIFLKLPFLLLHSTSLNKQTSHQNHSRQSLT